MTSDTDKGLILLVEDERGIASAFSILLQMEGYRVTLAGNGLEALEQLALHEPDLIMTDCMMPVMDGLTLIARLRDTAAYRHIPILLMSAGLPPAGAGFGGADAFLQMPAGVDALVAEIENLLRRRDTEAVNG